MQAISFTALQQILSPARLKTYQTRPEDPPRVVVGRYRWNIALCASIYPALCHIEVALRNRIHLCLSKHYATSAWYDITPKILLIREQEAISRAKQELEDRRKREAPDDMVASLSFGFWTGLLNRPYEGVLWPKLLKQAFPFMPRHICTRKTAWHRMDQVRRLRNRISHNEPIWHWKDLEGQYRGISEAINWFEPALGLILPSVDRFEDVYKRGPGAYAIDLK